MKRALLFMSAALLSFSGFSQTVDTLTMGLAGDPVWGPAQLDTTQLVPIGGNGSAAGVNDRGWNKFAQLYTFNKVDSGKTINGCISIWIGNMTTLGGTNSLSIQIWNVDSSNAVSHSVTAADSVSGFPGTSLTSEPVLFATIKPKLNGSGKIATPIYHPANKLVTNFTTPVNVSRPFFLGYVFPPSYSWTGMGTDTISLGTTPQPVGSELTYYTNYHNGYTRGTGTLPGGGKMFLSINSYYDPTAAGGSGAWLDYYQDKGKLILFNMVPIVQAWSDGVSSITRNNLSFFGCYPNPAIANSNIKFALKNAAPVSIEVMDMAGHTLKTINQGNMSAGEHTVPVSVSDLSAGNYLYMIQAGPDAFATQVTVVK